MFSPNDVVCTNCRADCLSLDVVFLQDIKLIIAPMIVAVMSIIYSMSLLIAFGYAVHIMSSMMRNLLTPIAVVNSVHIISTFFDEYQEYKDQQESNDRCDGWLVLRDVCIRH